MAQYVFPNVFASRAEGVVDELLKALGWQEVETVFSHLLPGVAGLCG